MRRKFLMLVCAGLVAACQTAAPAADRYTPAFLQANLIKGKTTKQQLIAIYGEPTDWSLSAGGYENVWWKESAVTGGLNAGNVLGNLGIPGAGAAAAVAGGGSAPEARRLLGQFHNGILTNYELFGGR